MTQFDDEFKTYAAPMIAEQHGETIWYHGSRNPSTQVTALRVDRLPAAPVGATPLPTYPIVIVVSQADVPVVRTNADTVSMLRRVDDTEQSTLTVREILSSEGGCWELGVS